jgi:hypothetical protein
MQFRINAVRIAVVLAFLAPSQMQVTAPKTDSPIRCHVWLEKTVIERGSVIIAHVLIENISREDVVLSSMSAYLRPRQNSARRELYFPERSYSSGIDVETGSTLKLVHDTQAGSSFQAGRRLLPAQHETELIVDLAALEWSEASAPALPWAHLYGVVINGDYDLDFTLGGEAGVGRLAVTFGKTELKIQGRTRRSP